MSETIYTIKLHAEDDEQHELFYTLEEAKNQLNQMSEMWPNAVIITTTVENTN